MTEAVLQVPQVLHHAPPGPPPRIRVVGESGAGAQPTGEPAVAETAPGTPGAGMPAATAVNQLLQVYSEEKVLT